MPTNRKAALTLSALTTTVRLHEHVIPQLDGIVYFRPLPTAFVLDNTLDKDLAKMTVREQNDNLQRTILEAVVDASGKPIFPDAAALNTLPIDVYNSISTALVKFMNPEAGDLGKAPAGQTLSDSSTASPSS